MRYIDVYLRPVPKKNLKTYLTMARKDAKIWRSHGALDYMEYAGDDLDLEWGVSFPHLMKIKPGETVVFSYITFKSKAHRDCVNTKVMKEMEEIKQPKSMPFDMKRLVYGGFKSATCAK